MTRTFKFTEKTEYGIPLRNVQCFQSSAFWDRIDHFAESDFWPTHVEQRYPEHPAPGTVRAKTQLVTDGVSLGVSESAFIVLWNIA